MGSILKLTEPTPIHFHIWISQQPFEIGRQKSYSLVGMETQTLKIWLVLLALSHFAVPQAEFMFEPA